MLSGRAPCPLRASAYRPSAKSFWPQLGPPYRPGMPNVQALPEIPPAVAAERKQVLDRTLRHLPDAALDAMRRGLDRHDGRLRPGKLFSAKAPARSG